MNKRPLVMGNWKLNGSKAFTTEFISHLRTALEGVEGVDVAIAPPAILLGTAEHALIGDRLIKLGAQNVDVHPQGAFTGDLCPIMLKEFGVEYVIIGHSERRDYHNESDHFIAQKFAILKEKGLTPVLCIGESEQENEQGETKAVLQRQLDAIIDHLGIEAFTGAVIAYEPIWAIGTGKSATPEQAQAIHAHIREYLASFDRSVSEQVIIQYGGSVNDKNAEALFSQKDIDGALVGGASLKADAFVAIVKAAAASK